MQFSTKAEYGLKAMANLAKHYPEQRTLRELAMDENISQKYLERLMNILRKDGLVVSSKGKLGGYILANKPSDIPVGAIIESLDGTIAPMKCVGTLCASEKSCPSSKVWKKLGKTIHETLYAMSLNELMGK